jgi:hypothetical protein
MSKRGAYLGGHKVISPKRRGQFSEDGRSQTRRGTATQAKFSADHEPKLIAAADMGHPILSDDDLRKKVKEFLRLEQGLGFDEPSDTPSPPMLKKKVRKKKKFFLSKAK